MGDFGEKNPWRNSKRYFLKKTFIQIPGEIPKKTPGAQSEMFEEAHEGIPEPISVAICEGIYLKISDGGSPKKPID